MDDMRERDYFDDLRKGARRFSNRLALFATCVRGWVARHWENDDWHCWGAAMLDNEEGYGKHVVIFDCEADMSQDFTKVRAKDLMLSAQTQFITWARGKYSIESVWYGNADLKPKPRECVLNTANWIKSFSQQLLPKFQGPDNLRLVGFAEIQRQ